MGKPKKKESNWTLDFDWNQSIAFGSTASFAKRREVSYMEAYEAMLNHIDKNKKDGRYTDKNWQRRDDL